MLCLNSYEVDSSARINYGLLRNASGVRNSFDYISKFAK